MLQAKSLERIMAANEAGTHKMKRVLGPWNLIGLGVGAVIGAGLFSVTGIAAAENAGPAIVLSFILAAIGCAFAGMCYAEFASMLPVSGSAYTYAHATLGELVAWVIGWTLVLEYALGAASVAVSWSAYVIDLGKNFGITLPLQIPLGHLGDLPIVLDIGAIFITCLLTMVLMRGISQSSKLNMVIVAVKVTIVLATICVGVFFINPDNYVPFIPENTGKFGEFGWSGVLRAAGILFFAYVGFDAVSTASQEAKDPQRSMPIGILGTLVVCTILYVGFGLVLTGMVNYKAMQGDAHPVATAINMTPFPVLQILVKVGIIGGFSTVILVMLLGQSRVFRAMAVDGLLPRFFSDIHPAWRTPWKANLFVMVFVSIFAGFLPISTLGNMVSIGTLLAFVIVCIGVMVLRKTRPELPRPYRTPLVPLVPILGILVCGFMMLGLSAATWVRLVVWLVIGMAVYFLYSRRHAHGRDSDNARLAAAIEEGTPG
jgi:basic amino acid/polyamine antiporter, APA family